MRALLLSCGAAVLGLGAGIGGVAAWAGVAPVEYRSIDGADNNLTNTNWGSVDVQLLRLADPAYADGLSTPAGFGMPGARDVSNVVCDQPGMMPNVTNATNVVWQWGQFVDHDIDLTNAAEPAEPLPIPVPPNDPVFDPGGTGLMVIPFNRSAYDPDTGTPAGGPRQQINQITAFIDASNVYGSNRFRAKVLRASDGTGKLSMSAGDLLPFNVMGLPNAGGSDPGLFLAGDVRANEHVALSSLHTLFVREHNRRAGEIRAESPGLSGNEIYERARAHVGALMQVITYKEFLPVLLGPGTLDDYQGYRPDVDPGIANEFSTACYRVGHTLLSPTILRLRPDGLPIDAGNLALRDAFFNPTLLIDEGGIEPIFRGTASARCQTVDAMVIDDVRDFLFAPPDPIGFDLAALNVQRGRDHGLPRYNVVRAALEMTPADDWDDICSDPVMQARLAAIYDSVDDVDLWLGAIAEDHAEDAMVGELVRIVLKDQFERLRDGDRFWYQLVFSGAELAALEQTTLADVIRRNSAIETEIQDEVFHMPPCLADVNRDGVVDVLDLLRILGTWGAHEGTEDLNGDGFADVLDLLELLAGMGPC